MILNTVSNLGMDIEGHEFGNVSKYPSANPGANHCHDKRYEITQRRRRWTIAGRSFFVVS
jgi:hypothetical protein